MTIYPQCPQCKRKVKTPSGMEICKMFKKPIEKEAMIFGTCPFIKGGR